MIKLSAYTVGGFLIVVTVTQKTSGIVTARTGKFQQVLFAKVEEL